MKEILTTDDSGRRRLWCIQASRGIACLVIAYTHWTSFLVNPDALASVIYQLPIAKDSYVAPPLAPAILGAGARLFPADFRGSYFAVGLFFLISGFVIPLSFGKASPVAFLLRRLLRIYPVVMATMPFAAAAILLGRFADHAAGPPFGPGTVLSNILLVRDLLGHQYIETALWTLEIEMHFYVLCFVLAYVNGLRKASVLSALALAFAAFAYLGAHWPPGSWISLEVNVIALDSGFITLMFVGTALYNYFENGWSFRKTVLLIVFLLAINKYGLSSYPTFAGATAAVMYANHVGAALFLFILLLLGDRLPYSRVIDKIANVSYPLYLTHGAFGYTVFYIAYKQVHSATLAFVAAAALVTALTILVHRYVELRGIAIGKRLAKQFGQRLQSKDYGPPASILKSRVPNA